MSLTINYAGDPNIGVFSRVINDLAIVPPIAPPSFTMALKNELDVEVISTTLQGTSIIGPLLMGNSRGMVVSGLVTSDEKKVLTEYSDVMSLAGPMTASGNVIIANDTFVGVHPDMAPHTVEKISAFLGSPAVKLTFGGIKTVGMAAVATDKGVLVHPRTNTHELKIIETASGIPVGRGSVNLGSGLIGTGLLINKKGYLAGFETSGFELGRIEEVFGFIG